MSRPDHDSASPSSLLARLNALKQSHITLSTASTAHLPSSSTSYDAANPAEPHAQDADLAARFRRLASTGLPSSLQTDSTAAAGIAQTPYEIAEEDTPHNVEDDQTIEELLAELGPDEQWTLDPNDPKDINSLLAEARRALPSEEHGVEPRGAVGSAGLQEGLNGAARDLDIEIGFQEAGQGGDEHGVEEESTDEQDVEKRDDAEADDYVARVLAELELERKYGGVVDQESAGEDNRTEETIETDEQAAADANVPDPSEDAGQDSSLNLPSAPTTLPPLPAPTPATDVDDALTARFASLSLPSAPSFSPAKKPVTVTKAAPKRADAYTDDDIASWCCICNEDATIQCRGCAGDLYCQSCWTEGHGTGPGQERGHRAVVYNRRAGRGLAAAA